MRAADQRGIGVMPVVGYNPAMQGEGYPGAEEWAKFLVDTLGKEPGLAFWDVCNEPDYPPNRSRALGRRVWPSPSTWPGVFRRLDGQTPVTIGFAYEYTMEQCADDVDVLVYPRLPADARGGAVRHRKGEARRRGGAQAGHQRRDRAAWLAPIRTT